MIGAPGAGKGTQAKVLVDHYGLVHVSSGDLFRDNLKRQTELGKLAQTYMDRGDLVPDDVTIRMVAERLARPDCKAGAVLDGFPRTPAQAEALDGTLADLGGRVNLVPFIQVPEDLLLERLTGRWTCRGQEQHVYHLKYNPPKTPGVCDIDGTQLYQREDDKAETVKRRVTEYLANTFPLVEFYRRRGLLVEINGAQPIEAVSEEMLRAVEKAIGETK
jgi:adenylate kinase